MWNFIKSILFDCVVILDHATWLPNGDFLYWQIGSKNRNAYEKSNMKLDFCQELSEFFINIFLWRRRTAYCLSHFVIEHQSHPSLFVTFTFHIVKNIVKFWFSRAVFTLVFLRKKQPWKTALESHFQGGFLPGRIKKPWFEYASGGWSSPIFDHFMYFHYKSTVKSYCFYT